MVTDVYSKIIDEDRRFNAQKMDKEFYSTLNEDTRQSTARYRFIRTAIWHYWS